MAEFALYIDGQFKEVRKLLERPEDIPHKKVTWLPFKVDKPNFDSETQVRIGPEMVVEKNTAFRRWVVREKTKEELAVDNENAIKKNMRRSRVALSICFDQENRLLALEGKPQITFEEFITAVEARLLNA